MSVLSFVPAHLIPLMVSLLSVYAFTRILPPEYGLYAIAMSVILLSQSTFFFWLELGTKRFYEGAQRAGILPTLAVTVYLGFLLAAAIQVAVGGSALLLVPLRPELRAVLWTALVVALLRQLSVVGKSFALASLSRRRFTSMECSESLIGLAAGIVFCRVFGMGPIGILAGLGVGAVAIIAFDSPAFVQRLRGGRVDGHLQRQLLWFAIPLTLSFFVEAISTQSDRVLISAFLNDQAVGIYSVSASLAERAISAPFLALGLAAYPLLVRMHEREGKEGARRQALSNVTLLLALAIPACGGFIVASGHLSGVLIGAAYAKEASEIMPFLAVAMFLFCIRAHYFAHSMHLAQRTLLCLIPSIPAALLNVLLNIVLLPHLGVVAAVWAKCIAYAVALAIAIAQTRIFFPLPFPTREAAKIVGATAVMCGLLAAVPFPPGTLGLAGMILSGAIVYGVLALLLNIAGSRDQGLRLLGRLRSRLPASAG